MERRKTGWIGLLAPLVAMLSPAPVASAADASAGEAAFLDQCGTCHIVAKTQEKRQGPNLHGVIGRRAGTSKGFKYSKALATAKFTWDRDRLDAWLTDTAKTVPGSVMNYRQPDPALRATIIGYLEAASGAAN
jgi:cytochrome c